jgi:hypothetical protein
MEVHAHRWVVSLALGAAKVCKAVSRCRAHCVEGCTSLHEMRMADLAERGEGVHASIKLVGACVAAGHAVGCTVSDDHLLHSDSGSQAR